MNSPHDQTLDMAAPIAADTSFPTIDADDDRSRVARLTSYGAVALLVLGWLVLYLGYNGAATHPQTPAQMPYVISGGFAGVGLLLLGGAMYVVNAVMRAQSSLSREIRGLAASLQDLTETLQQPMSITSGLPSGQPDGVVVFRGASSYHVPGCKLIAARKDTRQIATHVALNRGLTPCRVCKPEVVAGEATRR